MYDLNDTIAAVASAPGSMRTIIRISGDGTIEICEAIFCGPLRKGQSRISAGGIAVDEELGIDAELYLFRAPHSYTGEDVAEIHFCTNSSVVEAMMAKLLERGLRMAGPGEFTARAYLNGKIDLSQAEAVNEVIVSSNTYQLAAAEKLLCGRLSQSAEEIRSAIMDCLSLIEAGLDFSEEDIEFTTARQTIERLDRIKKQLEELLAGSIGYESVIDLPAVGIAGATNAGKSSLVNTLLGAERSIVSHERKTTRDVLTGVLELQHCKCVLFDCAGLLSQPQGILDELAQAAAIEALRNSSVVVLCVDLSKDNWAEDVAIREWIDAGVVIPVATKSDLLGENVLTGWLGELKNIFAVEFLPVSATTGSGMQLLREAIDRELTRTVHRGPLPFSEASAGHVALTARHRRAVTEAIDNIDQALDEFEADGTEVTAMMLRAAYHAISTIEQPQCIEVDEQILEQIFSSFCIGK
ncbi:MAG: 50S ribosome-binding GTPase [Sedimentisphaerales bacterium]|nr:50S ribosome-binding GTPase [Sedimentisphaerales bacterium]